jgi:hypothetical protein
VLRLLLTYSKKWTANAGQNLDLASENRQAKPVLDAAGFQRLLAAAYVLQTYNFRSSVQPIGVSHTSTFAASAIVQKRTPSLMIREPQRQARQPEAVLVEFPANQFDEKACRLHVPASRTIVVANEIAQEHLYSASLRSPVAYAAPRRIHIQLSKLISWRTTEAAAITIVFCLMVAMSIHRLSALPGRTSLSAEAQPMRPMGRALPRQTVVTQSSGQSPDRGESDVFADDVVIRYRERGPAARVTTGRRVQAQLLPATDTVIQYGDDVRMLVRKPERAGRAGLGR